MLKLVPKYQKGKVLPTPQQLQQAIDKKYPDYAWAREALAYSKLIDNYNRTNAQASYRAARNAKFSREQARKYAEVGDPDSWVTAPFSWLIKKYYGVQAKHPIINAILP